MVLCDIHGNELRQIDLITGAPHGINLSLLNLVGDMGRIYILLNYFVKKLYFVLKSLVLYDIHGNELHQIDLITGSPHDVNPSLHMFGVCLYIGRIYTTLKPIAIGRGLFSLMKST